MYMQPSLVSVCCRCFVFHWWAKLEGSFFKIWWSCWW